MTNIDDLTKEQKLQVMDLMNEQGLSQEEAMAYVLDDEKDTIEGDAEPSTADDPETTDLFYDPLPSDDIHTHQISTVQNNKPFVKQMSQNDLTMENIKKYLCPTATEQEVFMFLQLCQYRGLNPFVKEAYLVKFGNNPATMVVSKDHFTQKAEENSMFDGFRGGVIIERDGDLSYREGQLVRKGEALIGGWAEVYRKDRKIPFVSEVSMMEYNKSQSTWKQIPATMIRKVALVQALREAFPSDLGGCYDSAEMGVMG